MVKTGSTIAETLGNGETERWLFTTSDKDAVRLEISSGSTPYEVDILTADYDPEPGEFDVSRYDSVLADGVEEFTDTQEHSIGTKSVSRSVVVEVSNTSGGDARFTGGVSLHDEDAPGSAERFVTRGGDASTEVYRDGAVSRRTIPGRTSAGANPKADDIFKNAPGQGVYVNLQPLGGTLKGTYTSLTVTSTVEYTTFSTASYFGTTGVMNVSVDNSNNEVIGGATFTAGITDTSVTTTVQAGFTFYNSESEVYTMDVSPGTLASGWQSVVGDWVSVNNDNIGISGQQYLISPISFTGAASFSVDPSAAAPVNGNSYGVVPWAGDMNAYMGVAAPGNSVDSAYVRGTVRVLNIGTGGR